MSCGIRPFGSTSIDYAAAVASDQARMAVNSRLGPTYSFTSQPIVAVDTFCGVQPIKYADAIDNGWPARDGTWGCTPAIVQSSCGIVGNCGGPVIVSGGCDGCGLVRSACTCAPIYSGFVGPHPSSYSSVCGPAGCGPIAPSPVAPRLARVSCVTQTTPFYPDVIFSGVGCGPVLGYNCRYSFRDPYWYYSDCGFCACPGTRCMGHITPKHEQKRDRDGHNQRNQDASESVSETVKHNHYFDTELEANQAFLRDSQNADISKKAERVWIEWKKSSSGTEKHVHSYYSGNRNEPQSEFKSSISNGRSSSNSSNISMGQAKRSGPFASRKRNLQSMGFKN